MIVLDENILANQRELLRSWRIQARQIGYNLGQKGIRDDKIITFLRQLRRPTFFTRDWDFYRRNLCHRGYCIVFLAVGQFEVAAFVRRLIRHPEFNTQSKRMGAVIRASSADLAVWRVNAGNELRYTWPRNGRTR